MKKQKNSPKSFTSKRPVGYAVVGLGWISQASVLPAFKNAAQNSKLVALVSSDGTKLKELGKKYKVPHLYLADQFEACLKNPEVDAIYIALPNSMHAEYTIRAAQCGKHVLCEKPMAVTAQECERMIEVAKENQVKLMVAYRLHFDPANLHAIETIKAGKIGGPVLFNSIFSYKIADSRNTRLQFDLAGGPLFDIGIYCINAARYLFQSEPVSVAAFCSDNVEFDHPKEDKKFSEVEKSLTAILKFPNDKLAQFACSFDAFSESVFQVIGTQGKLELKEAFETSERTFELTGGKKTTQKTFKKTDQFGPELIYFSKCVLENKEPEPSGLEGLADIHIIQSLYQSIQTGRIISLREVPKKEKPSKKLKIVKPSFEKPTLIHAIDPAA